MLLFALPYFFPIQLAFKINYAAISFLPLWINKLNWEHRGVAIDLKKNRQTRVHVSG